MDIKKASLNKRWLGYRTECGLFAKFAILVNYEIRSNGGIKAFVFATGEKFEGEVYFILNSLTKALNDEFVKNTGLQPPPNDRGFFTQSWQKESRVIASGELFSLIPYSKESYTPPWANKRS